MNPKLERYRAAQLNQYIGGNKMNPKYVAIFSNIEDGTYDRSMCYVDEKGKELIDWMVNLGLVPDDIEVSFEYGSIPDFTN